ncbi:MAG: hypothetical protein DRJ98_01315 [Thermoprotei archaeon]|nr:MAG: hypothetical protein DRJ98_01315 [Thermoprotei archaeon]RLF17140.1 MAG: hypothetical protein DRN06_04320 [Thermoprotei archaeon]
MGGVSAPPDLVIWLVTARCNMSCAYCYMEGVHGELGADEAIAVAKGLVELAPSSVGITGGEPLLWRPLRQVLEILSANGVSSSVQSNLTLFSPSDADFFAEHNIFLFTSLDGPAKKIHEKFRGPGSWEALLRGLKLARDAGLQFATVTTISWANVRELPSILELSRQLGSSYAAFLPVIPAGRAATTSFLPSSAELLEAFYSLRDAADLLGFKASIWCAPFAYLIGPTKHFHVYECNPRRSFDILPSGIIPVCDTLRIPVSDVKKGVAEAWREYLAHPLINEIAAKLPSTCKSCAARDRCRGGCKARAYALTGSFEEPDPLCPLSRCTLGAGRPSAIGGSEVFLATS